MKTNATPRKATWLGVPGETWSLPAAGPQGYRVHVMHWLGDAIGQPIEHPAGTYDIRVLSGTHRDGNLVVHAQYLTTDPEQAATTIAALAR